MTPNRRHSTPSPSNRPLRNPALYPSISLGLLLLLTSTSALLVYLVSPLRDPAFQPNSANAGSLIPLVRQVQEQYWIWGAAGLAGLLAVNLVLLLWQLGQPLRTVSIAVREQRGITAVWWGALVVWVGVYVVLGLVLFAGLSVLFVGYLVGQWLVD